HSAGSRPRCRRRASATCTPASRWRPARVSSPDMQPTYYPLYFAPDLDPAWSVNPGLLIDVVDLVPSKRNTLLSYVSDSTLDLSGTFSSNTYGSALMGAITRTVSGGGRLVVGTAKRLMEHTGSAWADRSLGGVDYTTATDW